MDIEENDRRQPPVLILLRAYRIYYTQDIYYILVIFTDLTTAFDCVNFQTLSVKLEKMEIEKRQVNR